MMMMAIIYDLTCTFGMLTAAELSRTQDRAAVLYAVDPPGGCAGCCSSYFCRCCVMTRIHREWKSRQDDVGKPTGCCFNFTGDPAVRKPHQSYPVNLLPPPPLAPAAPLPMMAAPMVAGGMVAATAAGTGAWGQQQQ